MSNDLNHTRDRWEMLYASGHQLSYPNDVFVRVTHRLFDPETHPAILDHGCGSGENLIHLAHRGFSMTGTDISESAIRTTRRRLDVDGLDGDLRVIDAGPLPFADASFDAVVSWQVLTYNTADTLRVAIDDLLRVIRPGGTLLVTLSAPDDYMHVHGRPLGDDAYELEAEGQEGTTVMIVPEERIASFFPGREPEIGWFGHDFADRPSRHWIVSVVR